MKKVLYTSLLFCAIPVSALCQSKFYLNPGLKVGFTFGREGGFTYGLEVSATTAVRDHGDPLLWVGPVVDLDFCKDRTKLHLGVQGSWVGGIEIGPTWIWEKDSRQLGFGVTLFGGLWVYGFYSYTYRPTDDGLHETGLYLKYHQLVTPN